ncbi:MAG: restriction endonuclease [Helicobacteraceae bacterium]|jgi:hypothetical protein|nr:restriction endonuclease [Helicobacteraceae bacterium]
MTKNQLFIELAKPDENGVSRWVNVSEFTGKYASLVFGNGADWARRDGQLAKKYNIEFDKSISKGNRNDRVRLNGFNTKISFNQNIRKDIKDALKSQNCVMLGVNGNSANVKIEIDHKDGRKTDLSVSKKSTQKIENFQPLCKAANDVKRQICKHCKETGKRWNAKNIKGNPYDFYDGNENYTQELGCVGCYQYDPVEYRKSSARKISKEICDNILKKLYPEDNL